jgi:hypothetical protein
MRRSALVLVGVLAAPLLVACSPPVNAAVGIGYDHSGRLVAAFKVCHKNIRAIDLDSHTDTGPHVSWRRDPPLRGLEQLALDGHSSGPWTFTGTAVPVFEDGGKYTLWASGPYDVFQGSVSFSGSDFLRLRPGQLLVRRHTSDPTGQTYSESKVIDIDDLPKEKCAY